MLSTSLLALRVQSSCVAGHFELRLIAGYLQVPGISSMTKQECEECILSLWIDDEAGGSSGKDAMEFEAHRRVAETHRGVAEAHRGGAEAHRGGRRQSEGWPRPRRVVD